MSRYSDGRGCVELAASASFFDDLFGMEERQNLRFLEKTILTNKNVFH